jgi:hypothetical protein
MGVLREVLSVLRQEPAQAGVVFHIHRSVELSDESVFAEDALVLRRDWVRARGFRLFVTRGWPSR